MKDELKEERDSPATHEEGSLPHSITLAVFHLVLLLFLSDVSLIWTTSVHIFSSLAHKAASLTLVIWLVLKV